MKRKTIKHHMDGLIALLLFGVFAVCVLAVLLTGADAYRRLTERDREAYNRRTCIQYVAERVRQADSAHDIAVKDFGGVDALVLDAQWEYVTYVYCYDGWLMELYCAADADLSPEDGERIMDLGSLELSLEDGLLTVSATDPQGVESTILLALRSGNSVPKELLPERDQEPAEPEPSPSQPADEPAGSEEVAL